MRRTQKLVLLSLLVSIALIVYAVEARIPVPIAIPGVKLGLSNMVSLAALQIFGPAEAMIVVVLRILLGSVLTGTVSSFLFSIVGGLLSNLVMILLYVYLKKYLSLSVISLAGAIMHNVGQLLVAAIIVQNAKIYLYLPVLLISAIITGIFVGMGSHFIAKHFNSLNLRS